MNFSEALEYVKNGKRVARKAWGKGDMAIYLVDNRMNNIQHIEFRSKMNCLMYAASSEDILAIDWILL